MQPVSRRSFMLSSVALAASAPMIRGALADTTTPIVFVHGNGDTAGLWITQIWRFESNGHARDRLFAIDFRNPLARSNDAVEQKLRSSTADQREQLAAFVAMAKQRTGAEKVALVGSSRGGNAIRNYIKNGGGTALVSQAVLCGATNHGVIVSDTILVGSEFNGNSPFLKQLNDGGNEIVPGVAWMTIRSDNYDKFAQPDGKSIGHPGTPTGIGFDAPALAGAENVVLTRLDHREVAFHPRAFAAMYGFIAGRAPATTDIAPEPAPVLNGKVNAMPGGVQTNEPVAGAVVEVHETDTATGERKSLAHRQTTGTDGLWGPFTAKPDAPYEFVIAVPDAPITHIYRSPFPRSSAHVHLRPGVLTDADRAAGSSVTMTRPRGYFGHGRDRFTLNGQVPPGIAEGVAATSTGTLRLPRGPQRPIVARCNDEVIVARNWPAAENRVVLAELHD